MGVLNVKPIVRLTDHSDYAVRVLMHLAVEPRPLATTASIAAAYGVSQAHLAKVVRRLRALGLVETVRGRTGGLRLARAPEEVVVGELIRHTEGSLALAECFRAGGRCAIAATCGLHRALRDALDAFLAALDGYTLADLVGPRRNALTRLLGIPAGRPRARGQRARGACGSRRRPSCGSPAHS